MCKQKKSKEDEIHLIILWNEKNIQECERYIINKFQVIKKIFIPSLLHKFGDNKRKHLVGAMYRYEIKKFGTKGCEPAVAFIILDNNPKYSVESTPRKIKPVNINMFELKHKLRKGRAGYLHTSDTPDEALDNIKVLSQIMDDPSIFDEWLKWRPKFKNMVDFFETLNSHNNLEYVIMRNYDNYPNEVQLDEHTDIDILVNDYFLFKAIVGGTSRKRPAYDDGGYKVCNKVNINDIEVDVDIRSLGDGYYCTKWQKDILDNKILYNGFNVMDKINHFYSLLYHALCHKSSISNTYNNLFLKFEPFLNLGLSKKNIDDEVLLSGVLDSFMHNKGYDYVPPREKSIVLRKASDGIFKKKIRAIKILYYKWKEYKKYSNFKEIKC